MKKLLSLFAVLPMFASCATLLSDDVRLKESAAQAGSSKRSGVVSYNPEGFDSIVEARRKSSYEKIAKYCGTQKVTISKEETVEVDPTESESVATIGASSLRKIHFACE